MLTPLIHSKTTLKINFVVGLFQKAIMNSGSTLNLWSLNTRASTIAKLTATNLGVLSTNSTELVENLRDVEVETLVRKSWLTGWGVVV